MAIKNKAALGVVVGLCVLAGAASAAEYRTNVAQMQAMDKITGRVSSIEVPVNGEVKFGTFSIVVRDCKTRSAEEIPENYAFVDVTDTDYNGKETNIFKGWMISSSPALNAVEHPIYDVWLNKCIDGKVAKSQLLSAEQLARRDEIEMVRVSEPDDLGREIPPLLKEEDVLVDVAVEVKPVVEEETIIIEESKGLEPSLSSDEAIGDDEGGPKSLFDFGKKEPEKGVENEPKKLELQDFSAVEEPLDGEELHEVEEDSSFGFSNEDADIFVSRDLFRFDSNE